jgi:hypothetical protein
MPMLNIAQGQAGVHRIISELIPRGYAPYLPVVDTGVDILLAGNIRLQVKTTLRASQHHRLPPETFSFTLSKAQTIKQQKFVSCAPRTFSEECDFVILVALEAQRVWIVPAVVLNGRYTAAFYKQAQWRDLDLDKMKELARQGLTFSEIARQIGSNFKTVSRRLRGKEAPNKPHSNLGQYENRWDLIEAVAGPAPKPAVVGVDPSTISEA